jgi:hypothetical protein
MENQTAPAQPPNKPSPSNAEGCQRGCLIVVAIFAALLIIGWIIGKHDLDSERYPGQPPSASGGSDYRRTRPGYDANAPLLPRDKDDIEPLYNEVERRKKEQGISDEEAVRQIMEEYEREKRKQ